MLEQPHARHRRVRIAGAWRGRHPRRSGIDSRTDACPTSTPGSPTRRCARSAAAARDASPDALWAHGAALRLADTRHAGPARALADPRRPGRPHLRRALPHATRSWCSTRASATSSPACAGRSGRSRATTRSSTGRTPSAPGPRRAPSASCFAHWVTGRRAAVHGGAREARRPHRPPSGCKALWSVIGRFEPLVATEPLTVATRRAAAQGRRRRADVQALSPARTPCSSPASADSPR